MEDPAARYRPVPVRRTVLLILVVWACGAISAHARTPAQPETSASPAADPHEGRPIRQIVIRRPAPRDPGAPPGAPPSYVPLDPATERLAMLQLRSGVGLPFQQRIAVEDVSRLNRLGRFRDIESRVQLQDDGSVVLYFTVTPQPVVTAVQSVGNRELSDQDIAAVTEILLGTPVDRFQLDRACRRVEDLYRTKGYYLAQVSVDEKELEGTGIALFRVREGERIKVTRIAFDGNRSFRSSDLKTQIKTTEAWLLNAGPLDDDTLDRDVSSLVAFYKDRGYLDVRADRLIRPSPNGREAIVTFLLDEGPVYTLRDVRVEFDRADRAPVFSREQLLGLMTIKPGDVYSQDKLRTSLRSIQEGYGKLGYADARIDRRELRDPDAPRVDILLLIREGEPFRTGMVRIIDNDLTQDRVVRRNLVGLQPDRPLDSTAVEESRARLRQLNIFGRHPDNPKITVQPEDPRRPGYRDVLVRVDETNTGEFNFGGSLSSDLGVGARIGITQRNFDILDTPDSFAEFFGGDSFRGAGQVFTIELLPGTQSQTYLVALTEPALFESDYSGSGSVYHRSRDYNQYDERRFGTTVSLGRRFGTRWVGSLPVRYEQVTLSDIDPGAPVDVFADRDERLLTSAGFSLTRSTFDNPFVPSRGSRVEFSIEQFGILGGDYTFTRFSASHAVFITLVEDFMERRTTLSFITRVGYVPQGKSNIPIYERFYAGGQSFRGFGYRAVGPLGIRNDTGLPGGDPVGGSFSFFFGPEIKIPVYEDLLSVVFFSDTGTILDEPGFDKYRVSVGTGLRFHIRQLSPAPLAFDFAIPVMREPSDRRRLFTFSIDIPFR